MCSYVCLLCGYTVLVVFDKMVEVDMLAIYLVILSILVFVPVLKLIFDQITFIKTGVSTIDRKFDNIGASK